MDLTFEVEGFPRPGETRLVKDFHTGFGGKGANQAVASAKTGGTVRVTGAVGDDGYGDETLENFRDHGIEAEYVFQLEESGTGLASISVNEAGENLITVAPRANEKLSREHVAQIPDEWFELDYLAGVNEVPEAVLVETFRRAKEINRAETVLNAAPARPITDELWELTDCLILNESETEFYISECPTVNNYEAVGRELLKQGPDRVVMTMGTSGSALVDDNQSVFEPAPEVDAVDTTGAGDAFVGAFISARSQDFSPQEALREANRYASESVKGRGTQKSFPDGL